MKTLLAIVMALIVVPIVNEKGVLFVHGTIDDSKPQLFVFDPGAGDFATSAAPKIGKTARIKVGDATITEALQVFSGDPNQLVPNHDARLGAIAGSLGPGLLAKYAIRVDYPHSMMELVPLSDFVAPVRATAFTLTVDDEGVPAITATADGVSGTFELDLRAPTSVLFTQFVQQNGFAATYQGKPVIKTGGLGSQYALGTFALGPFAVRDVPTWFSTATQGKFAGGKVAGLIGNNALARFIVTLDYRAKKAYLERP